VRVLEKRLGALPVVAEFGRRLRIAEIVDELCPVRPVAWISHGEVIEALVANRLTAPAPLVRVEEWAAAMAVEEAYGIEPHLLNDDRIARALDAVAPQLDAITGGVGVAAISEFGVDVARLHWDMTSISLYGAYPDPDGEYPAPQWGHPKDRRPDLRQVQTGLAVSGDGGIPVFHRGYDGGAGEVAQVTGAMTALQQIAGPRRFLLVGDSKLISYTNAAAMTAQGVGFVAPLAASRVPAGLFAALPAGAGTEVDYVAARDAGKPPPTGPATGWPKMRPGWTCTAPAKPTRWCTCAGSWCTPRRTPPARPGPGRPRWPRPPRNWTSWYAPPGPGSTRTPRPSPPASRRSPPDAAPGSTCAPPSPPARPANPSWPGASTRPRSTPKPPPTAGKRC
jgi:hypothetical protein